MFNLRKYVIFYLAGLMMWDSFIYIFELLNVLTFGLIFVPQLFWTFIWQMYHKRKMYIVILDQDVQLLPNKLFFGMYSTWEFYFLFSTRRSKDELISTIRRKVIVLNLSP